MDNTEQWNLQGKCNLCRRVNYCSKECTAHKRAKEAFISGMVQRALDEVSDGAYSKIMNQSRF